MTSSGAPDLPRGRRARYPQFGERIAAGNIQASASQANKKRFAVRRILGAATLVTEFVLTYDGHRPTQ